MSNPVIIGNATLYLGDCRELLPALAAEVVVTDPPYLDGDQSDVLNLLPTERAVVTPGKLEAFNWIRRRIPDWEYVWRGSQVSRGGRYCLHIGFEPILSYGWPLKPLGTDVLTFPIAGTVNETGHPWPKPIALMEYLVERWSALGDVVLDPFMGSGTTGMACAKLGRRFVGIEINPEYFEIACRRIEEASAQGDLFIASSEEAA